MNDEQQQMAEDIREIKLAVLGDENVGLKGLVGDMREMKAFRSSLMLRSAAVAGFVAAIVGGGKAVLAKIFSGP